MEDTALIKVFRRLSQGSKQSVQSGKELDAFDKYMHVDRPIDKVVRDAMNDIQQEGGGILFLVGSAGDGKSHMISTLNKEYPDFMFKNDASESPWPGGPGGFPSGSPREDLFRSGNGASHRGLFSAGSSARFSQGRRKLQ